MGTYLSTPKTEKETERGKGKDVEFGVASMQGWRKTMEDAHITATAISSCEDACLFAVFDGHGGSEVAKFCAKHMRAELESLGSFRAGDYDSALTEVFHRMDTMLLDEAHAPELAALSTASPVDSENGEDERDESALLRQIRQLQDLKKMVIQNYQAEGVQYHAGCTAAVAYKHGNKLYVANAGDSRGVLCRGDQAVALSIDHKPMSADERDRIEAAGGTVNEVGGVARVNGNLNLSRAIGDLKYKTNERLPPEKQVITAHPDVRIFELTREDRFFILACDGVWDVLTNQV